MTETKQLVRFLKLATDQRIADANQGKIVNKWRKFYVIGLMILMYILFLTVFTDHSFLEKVGFIVLVLILGGIALFLLRKDEGFYSIYITNQLGKRINLYDYRLEMVYLYLLKGYISANHSNLAFYDSVLSKTTEIKKESSLSPRPLEAYSLSALIVSVFAPFLSGSDIEQAEKFRVTIVIITILFIIFGITLLIHILINERNKWYFLLHSILTDLRIKDCIKFKGSGH